MFQTCMFPCLNIVVGLSQTLILFYKVELNKKSKCLVTIAGAARTLCDQITEAIGNEHEQIAGDRLRYTTTI